MRFQNLLALTPSVFSPNVGTQRYPVRVPGSTYSPNQNARVAQGAQSTFTDSAGQPATRLAGVHVMGMELIKAKTPPGTPAAGSAADGSWVGANDVAPVDLQVRASGLVAPGRSIVYTFTAKAAGAYLLYSTAADVGDPLSFGGQLMQGLFGAVTGQPKTAEWYRSQVTKAYFFIATTGKTADGHPIIDYDKLYPPTHPRKGQPILKMLDAGSNIVYSDLTAIITGPKHGRFDCADCPDFKANPSYPIAPSRTASSPSSTMRFVTTQAFPPFSTPGPSIDNLMFTLRGGRDFFAINYGIGGIGAEVWPTGSGSDRCTTARLQFEEFFLSSWAVGDPAMLVDIPANAINPATGQIRRAKATKASIPTTRRTSTTAT